MNFPKVSIITVVYNSKKSLATTLESIKKIQYPNKEIIIVDGNSSDGTKEIIEKNYLDISKWISEPDSGIYDAMNKGIGLSTGEFIWFINAGDKIHDSYILDHIFKGKEHYSDFYYGDTLILSSDGEILGLRGKKPSKRLKFNSFKRGMTVCHQSMIVRRSIVPKYNLIYRYSSDFDWVIRILKKDIIIENCNTIFSTYLQGGTTSQNRLKSLIERYHIMVNHYGVTSTIWHHFLFIFKMFLPKYRKYIE